MSETKSDTISEVSAEQLVADRVDALWQHIAENRFDTIADIAVDALQKDGSVPVAAFFFATKTAWCNHEIAVRTMTQLQSERKAADRARGDAQSEHSKRREAEREAEGLKADLAQSMLLVENQRLRLDEARAQGAEWCRRIRELQDSLQQRQRTDWCQQIRKLENSLQKRRQELDALFTANQELQQKLETAEAALLEQQQRNEELVTQGSQQHMKIAELQQQVEADKTQELPAKTQELPDKTQEQPAEFTPPDGWRLLPIGETLRDGDEYVESDYRRRYPTKRVGSTVGATELYIRRIEQQPEPRPEPVQGGLVRDVTHYLEVEEMETPTEIEQDADLRIRLLKECNNNQCETIQSMRKELQQVRAEMAGAIQSRDLFAEANRQQADKIAELQRQVEALTIIGL